MSEEIWKSWLERWDHMQEGYLPWREHEYSLMLDCLDYWVKGAFTALDLACGPGSISSRLITRFPQATSMGVDFDPVLLSIGRHTLGTGNGRMTWLEADLRDPDWARKLPFTVVDAVLSSTALHWLAPDELAALYVRLASLLRPGGMFLNADEMRPGASPFWPFFRDWSRGAWRKAFESEQSESWERFWAAVSQDPLFHDDYRIRQQRISTLRCTSDAWGAPFELHAEILKSVGFQAVDTIWQEGIERVMVALR